MFINTFKYETKKSVAKLSYYVYLRSLYYTMFERIT